VFSSSTAAAKTTPYTLPELPYACGLGTLQLMAADVTRDSLIPENGTLPVRRQPDELSLSGADDVTRDWWLERLARVEALS